jgi:hypothetical protein
MNGSSLVKSQVGIKNVTYLDSLLIEFSHEKLGLVRVITLISIGVSIGGPSYRYNSHSISFDKYPSSFLGIYTFLFTLKHVLPSSSGRNNLQSFKFCNFPNDAVIKLFPGFSIQYLLRK